MCTPRNRYDREPHPKRVMLLLYACAQAAHEVNRAYCLAIGDNSQRPWDEAPQWQRESAIKGVEGVLEGNAPEQSHESWLDEKVATGWKYGPIKDPEKKEHPCMVAYSDLPDDQRKKDELFVATVKSVAQALGFIKPSMNKVGQLLTGLLCFIETHGSLMDDPAVKGCVAGTRAQMKGI